MPQYLIILKLSSDKNETAINRFCHDIHHRLVSTDNRCDVTLTPKNDSIDIDATETLPTEIRHVIKRSKIVEALFLKDEDDIDDSEPSA